MAIKTSFEYDFMRDLFAKTNLNAIKNIAKDIIA